jgi:hypothetical protein
MPAESDVYVPPFEVTPEMQEQLALLTRQAMAQLEALVAAMNAAATQLAPPPPPPETIIPIVEEPPPGVVIGELELSALALQPPILLSGPIDKAEGGFWSSPLPQAIDFGRHQPVELPVIAVELPAVHSPAGFAVAEVVDLSGFWHAIDQYHGGEGGMF